LVSGKIKSAAKKTPKRYGKVAAYQREQEELIGLWLTDK